jgi:hypothetical protein
VATAKQVRRRGRLSLILGTFIAAILLAAVAYADQVTGATAEVRDKTTGSTAWSNDVDVDVVVSMVHCPPGGDEDAVDVFMSNASNSGPWTLVHDGLWPNGDCDGVPAPVGPATFSWTLPAGDAAAKTVYVLFRHGTVSNDVVVSDAIGLDTQAPTITDEGVQSGTLGGGGWYRSAVVNRFSASDGGSGLDGACAAAFPKNVSSGSAEGSNVFIPSGACSDVAGNTNGGINAGPFMIDLTAPTITDDGPASAPDGANGWYVSAVSNSFSATDTAGGSGLDAACAAAFPKSVSSGSDEGPAVKVSSGACADVAGNNNPGIQSAAFLIDLTDPSVAITSPVDGFTTSASSVAVNGTASDSPSDIASVTVNGAAASYSGGTFSSSVALTCGANTITAEATDVAGRTSSDSVSVTRTCVTLTGFYSPVDASNIAKAGQGVPFKWNAYNGAAISVADEITSTSGFVVSSMKVSCELLGTGDAVPAADDAGASGIRYDFFETPTATAQGQFVFVWKTLKDWANTCRVFEVSHSGVELTAFFRFTR